MMNNNNNDDTDRIRRIIKSEEETRADGNAAASTSSRKSDSVPPTRPSLDKNNMPLPRRVDEIDLDGTRVTRAAYEPTTDRRLAATRVSQPPPEYPPSFLDTLRARLARFQWRGNMGCFLRTLIVMTFVFVVIALCTGSYLLLQYYTIARTLPDINDLQNHASQFETTRILDRNGQLLYEILDPTAGRRTYVPLENMSPNLVAATIATEDKDFYSHPGFDFWAMVRALWQNYRSGGTVSGASTITQQLARALLLSPEERAQRTYSRKAREIILAAEITRRYTKDQILELYLNEIYYGNLAYGAEAASETYFGKNAKDLTLAEASFLAGLPQSPAVYDIYTNPEVTLIRQQQVLVLMFELSQAHGCIHVSNDAAPVCVDPVAATDAANAMKAYVFRPPSFDARYPHWVNFVREQLEEQYDAQTIYRSGFTVYTTLDPVLQDQAQQLVTDQIASMADKNAHNGALVAIRPSTGEILAMVGSPDFYNDAIAGQINMANSPTRQPGSSIKPINYVAAFEKGWTPSTLIWDVPSEFPPSGDPNDTREPYIPVNYDGKFHGPVTVRVALSNSFNIPAVKTLQFVGVYDDPNTPQQDGMIAMAKRLGITSLTRDDYGLSLTLGGGDVSLLELTSAYSVFANAGQRVPPVAILKITDFSGKVIYEYQPQPGEQVIRPEHAYLISSILSDNNARSWMFGTNSMLNLSFPVAAKTGTTNDFRDNWTLGYTPDLVTGVWVGNADYTPMVNTTGLSGAAPIWSQFMEYAVPYVTGGNPTPFNRPPGIIDRVVCSLSGTEPSAWCKGGQYTEVFAADQPPLPASQDLIRHIKIDLWTGLQASDQCKGPADAIDVLNVTDKWARQWFGTGQGRDWLEQNGLPRNPYYAPDRECTAGDPQAVLDFALSEGQVITSPTLNIAGTAYADGAFKSWKLEYGFGDNPGSWALLTQSEVPVKDGPLYTWDLSSVSNGTVTLKLTLIGDRTEVEKRIHLTIGLPTPTPAPATPTVTAFPPTAVPPTDVPSETPTLTPFPSETPTETPTP